MFQIKFQTFSTFNLLADTFEEEIQASHLEPSYNFESYSDGHLIHESMWKEIKRKNNILWNSFWGLQFKMNDFTLFLFTLLFFTVHCQYDYQVTTGTDISDTESSWHSWLLCLRDPWHPESCLVLSGDWPQLPRPEAGRAPGAVCGGQAAAGGGRRGCGWSPSPGGHQGWEEHLKQYFPHFPSKQ